MLWNMAPSGDSEPVKQRKLAATRARSELESAFNEFQRVAGSARFDQVKSDLVLLRARHTAIPTEYQRKLGLLKSRVRDTQLRQHLERFSIRSAQVTGIGDSRKQLLASFGITSAADVDANKLANVRGFGPVLIAALERWRHQQASTFHFDPTKGIDPQDLAKLNRETEALTRKLEAEIKAGAAELQQVRHEIEAHRKRLIPALESLALKSAQAAADAAQT